MTRTVQERIVQLMRSGQPMTRQDIAEKLSLSMPTVLQNVTRLMEANILEECGTTQSNGGRKAKMLRLCPEAGYVLGVNIGIRQIDFVTADLLGNLRQSDCVTLPFRDEPKVCYTFCPGWRGKGAARFGAVTFPHQKIRR